MKSLSLFFLIFLFHSEFLYSQVDESWEKAFAQPKGLRVVGPGHPQANRRGEIINDRKFIEKVVSETFGDEESFLREWYLTEARLEYYFSISPRVDEVLAPRIAQLQDSLVRFEEARVQYEAAIAAWNEAKPFDSDTIVEPLRKLRDRSTQLSTFAKERVGFLNAFRSSGVNLQDIQTWFDRIDEDQMKRLREVEKESYLKVQAELAELLPNFRSRDKLVALPEAIVALYILIYQVQSFLTKFEPTEFVFANWFLDEVDRIRESVKAEKDWLERIMPLDALASRDKKNGSSFSKLLPSELPETEPNFYFSNAKFEKELNLAMAGVRAPQMVSGLLREIGEQSGEVMNAQLQDIRNQLPFENELAELMSPEDAANERRRWEFAVFFKNLPYRFNLLTTKDFEVLDEDRLSLEKGVLSLQSDYRACFIDPQSPYVSALKARVDAAATGFRSRLGRRAEDDKAKLELVSIEAVLREDLRARRYHHAWINLQKMKNHLGDHIPAFEQYENYILENNNRSEFAVLFSEIVEWTQVLERSKHPQRLLLAERSLKAMNSELLSRVAFQPEARLQLEALHRELQMSVVDEARDLFLGREEGDR